MKTIRIYLPSNGSYLLFKNVSKINGAGKYVAFQHLGLDGDEAHSVFNTEVIAGYTVDEEGK